jgi:uncharacterized protein YbbK (DUF523 family)
VEHVLVSACLLGEAVRFDGGDQRCDDAILQRWRREGRVVPVCPEVAGGLPVPRARAEVAGGGGGAALLAGGARAFDSAGREVTEALRAGAGRALALAMARGIRLAVLKEGSPSCGSGHTPDGSFTGARVPRPGVTAALLQEAGIRVFGEAQLAEADAFLQGLEAGD